MTYNAAKAWNKTYREENSVAYPAEGVIRIFKGAYPSLSLKKPCPGDKVVDVGCGDGRHLALFSALGLESTGIEITSDIVAMVSDHMEKLDINTNLMLGSSSKIPLDAESQDYLLTWNSCYYMSHENSNFEDHVEEMARVLKPQGYIVASIPKPTCFIFKDTQTGTRNGYRTIVNDFWNDRNGEIMRYFESSDEIHDSFKSHFFNFSFADIEMDWFGLRYDWFVFVAQRR